ncbi:MAG TPA: OmpA family protein [bacterium]|nr:OmpA family protein [bacterium]
MKNSRLAVAVVAILASLAASRMAQAAEPMPLMAPEASSPGACPAEVRQAKKCARWYELNEKSSPDACKASRLSGEKCQRWYSVGAPAPKAAREEVIVLRGINFDTAKADIKPESVPILEKNVSALQRRPKAHITVEGHTDSRGSDAYNQKLSEARANSVLNWFAAHGIERERMSAVGRGESSPVADNTTQDGMYQNRRIELHLQ